MLLACIWLGCEYLQCIFLFVLEPFKTFEQNEAIFEKSRLFINVITEIN